MNKLDQLANQGQSIWLDFIRRAHIESGSLAQLVEEGLRGVTSNPSIFEQAIAGSTDYDQDLKRMLQEGLSVTEIYEDLVIRDIQMAADVLLPVFERTDGLDGYVSLEVNPNLAQDTEGTLTEARRLSAAVDRPNLMIKVPATAEGIQAIETLIQDGIHINVTLLFSINQYQKVTEAFLRGLESRVENGVEDLKVASVASFFVSRVDGKVDPLLEAKGRSDLAGKTAIANARTAYALFEEIFAGGRWQALEAKGARVQRLLWASTSTKNSAFSDTLYVDELIGPHTINTLPPATLSAFLDHGDIAPKITTDLDAARGHLAKLGELGIDLDQITRELLNEGLASFSASYEALLAGIETKQEQFQAGWFDREASLGPYEETVTNGLANLSEDKIISRIWAQDHTVWAPSPQEISNRLGWLRISEAMQSQIERLNGLRKSLFEEGFTQVLLLGMGGSSLAPEVFRKTFGVGEAALDLAVLDSTDPSAVSNFAESLDLKKTIFIVATKSGGTVETLSFLNFFYTRMALLVGADKAGSHFIAITDAGSKLDQLAKSLGFRETFHNDPNIGGRYAALSYFGLVPATLIGVDLERLLNRAVAMAAGCDAGVSDVENPAAWLGVIMGEMAKAGRDKITFFISSQVASFGDWVEQLIAESTGKERKGILPVVGESLGSPEIYADDRLFVHLRLEGDFALDSWLQKLADAGHPVIQLHLQDRYDLGGQIFLWEMATAVAGHIIGIQPFDQPDVEAAKVLARRMVTAYHREGRLPELIGGLSFGGITLHGVVQAADPADGLKRFLSQKKAGDYIAIQAYLQPTVENAANLQTLRMSLRERYRLATTVGFGPRFLHSTGQLHKGDRGNGLFIQIISTNAEDLGIPDEAGSEQASISFGILKSAQALGDRQALVDVSRRVLRIHLKSDAPEEILKLLP